MKINFILTGLGDSGGIRVVKKYAEILNKKGIDTIIYCPIISNNVYRFSSNIINWVHQMYCTLKTIMGLSKKKDVKWIPCISSSFVRDADFTIATLWPTAFKVANLEAKCGEKWYFIQGYEIWDNEKKGLLSYELPINKMVISTWINQQLKEKPGVGPFPVVWNGVDTNIFNTKGRTIHEGITFLMLNHIMEIKGVKNGLAVLKRIHLMYPNAKFRMFGMCSNNNIPKYVDYIRSPSREDLVKLYQDTDIFIYPSIEEGWGLTPIEAMACGCVVVGTNTGFTLDIGVHKVNMMISEPSDVDGMVDNIKMLIEDNNLYKNIQKNAVELLNVLTWEKSCNRFLDILCKGKSNEEGRY